MKFLDAWGDAALTTAGYFWTAFWAFCLGYLISAAIQLFVSRDRMRRHMGDDGPRSIGMATFFGFISSSCSFAALATARSLFAKGAGFIASMAFLLASTNLVIELGIVISVFLSWHFVVGEYLGGVILIGVTWLLIRVTGPRKLIQSVRERLEAGEPEEAEDPRDLLEDRRLWERMAQRYAGEWQMVWKDVTVGFTVAGIIAAFVPAEFYATLFPGTGTETGPTLLQVVAQALIGPVAAFFTFIGSMGNIPLAGILFQNGVSVAGVMAFIFSDLVVFPVIRVNARFYGWKMALYIAGVFLLALVVTALVIQLLFTGIGLDPEPAPQGMMDPAERFAIDRTFWLNIGFLAMSLGFGWLIRQAKRRAAEQSGGHEGHGGGGHHHHHHGGAFDRVLYWLALVSFAWLAAGLVVALVV
ncbi:permease [Marinibacterium profundimaris]|uniref:Permease n=1 Tax=Marinibacterium profundimaris TaxID=1679460 RepID=A0A225NRM9_9RHOB|nr:permease [Marinibacterium profundimaris]OWU77505.1 permease [Marinibacterium profundimaris]